MCKVKYTEYQDFGKAEFCKSQAPLMLLTARIHNYFAACVIAGQKPQTFNIFSVVLGRSVNCGSYMLICTLRLQRMIHRTGCGKQESSSWIGKLFKFKNWKEEIHKHYLDPGTHKNKAEITTKYCRLINKSLDTQNTYYKPCLYYKKQHTHDVQRTSRCVL